MLDCLGMAKKGKRTAGVERRKKTTRLWQGLLGLIVIGGMIAVYVVRGRESSSETQSVSANQSQSNPEAVSPTLRNRLVLPAWPQKPRPFTLSPNSFNDSETRQAYQAAKDVPEVLENIACYCGCYGTAGHRNNLDCYKDNHGVT